MRTLESPRHNAQPRPQGFRRLRLPVIVAGVTIALTACWPSSNDSRSATAGLPDILQILTSQHWVLDNTSSTPTIVSRAAITLGFTREHTLSGEAPCNVYRASFTLDDNAIKIHPIAQTLRGCAAPVMAAEHTYLTALQDVTAVRNSSRDKLELTGPSSIHLIFKQRGSS
jgi:heat shock protein HslJ